MTTKAQLKGIIRSSYDRHAQLYRKYSTLQKVNLENLIAHAERWNTSILPGLILDAGCGIPDSSVIKRKIFSDHIYGYVGLDLSFSMLSASASIKSCMRVNGDLEAIPFRLESFSVAISNSVLHWLNFPEHNLTPLKACKEIFSVLKKGGTFIISVSAAGTARRFQEAFYEISKTVPYSFFEDRSLLRRDPIGSMELHELIKVLELAGFSVIHALMEYEPVYYKKTDDYINHVKAYGEYTYLSTFAKQHRKAVWEMISERFKDLVGEHNYRHDQFMIYAVALKEMKNKQGL